MEKKRHVLIFDYEQSIIRRFLPLKQPVIFSQKHFAVTRSLTKTKIVLNRFRGDFLEVKCFILRQQTMKQKWGEMTGNKVTTDMKLFKFVCLMKICIYSCKSCMQVFFRMIPTLDCINPLSHCLNSDFAWCLLDPFIRSIFVLFCFAGGVMICDFFN